MEKCNGDLMGGGGQFDLDLGVFQDDAIKPGTGRICCLVRKAAAKPIRPWENAPLSGVRRMSPRPVPDKWAAKPRIDASNNDIPPRPGHPRFSIGAQD